MAEVRGAAGVSLVVAGILRCGTPPAARAQRPEDLAAVDSAAVARAAWGRGVAAFRRDDLGEARREIGRAASAWPTQPAYPWGLAVVSARAGDATATLAALRAYAALGLGRDLTADSAFAPFLTLPDFRRVRARHDAGRAPLRRSVVRATLPDSTFWPEGMDYDPRTGDFYVASVRHGTVARVRPDGQVHELWPRHVAGMGAVLGVRVDTLHDALWVTTSGIPQMEGYTPADSAIAAVLRVRISDGAVERRWDLPAVPGGHVLGDLAVGKGGDVFVTDSYEPVLYRLRGGSGSLERFTSPLFRSLQGVAPTPDGERVYVADYSHGILLLSLASGAVIRLADAPGSTSLGCDGIAWSGGSVIAIQNGVTPARIVRFVLDASGRMVTRVEVLDRNVPRADEPTIGAVVGDHFVYVANSQWEKYDSDGSRRGGVALTAPILLSVPLRR
jgi:sugar lactone lactonase YvrE